MDEMEQEFSYTKKELKEIEQLRKRLGKLGMLESDGMVYVSDGECIDVETAYDLGMF